MSKNTGFSDTSASRYSLALYELSHEAKVLFNVEENSNAFLKLISINKEFNDLVKDPTLRTNRHTPNTQPINNRGSFLCLRDAYTPTV